MSVTPEKDRPRNITAAIMSSTTNNELLLRRIKKWQTNLNMKDEKLQRPIILIMRK